MRAKRVTRIAAMLAVAAVLMLPACSQASPTPAPTEAPPTFEPAPAGEVQKAKIAVDSYYPEGWFDSIEQQLNKALADAGQNVEFEIQRPSTSGGSDTPFLDKVREEMATGSPSADAFPFFRPDSIGLFNEGLTMDVTELVLQNAPVYYSKYKELLPARLTGIPIGVQSKPVWSKLALMLRQDFASAGSGITTTDGLLQFIDETIAKPGKPYCVLAFENDLVIQWALERGYYTQYMAGMNGGYFFYAIDDDTFTPVPLENIPGFADFILETKKYRKNGILNYPFQDDGTRECVAFVNNLGSYYFTGSYANIPFAPGEFTAQLLSPEMPGDFSAPNCVNELAIPAVCSKEKAAQTPLISGKPLQGQGNEQSFDPFLTWPGVRSLYNFDFYRLPSFAPANTEELMAEGLKQNRRFPLSAYVSFKDSLDEAFATSDEIKLLSSQRESALGDLIMCDPATATKESITASLESLKKINTKWLIEQYSAMIERLKAGK